MDIVTGRTGVPHVTSENHRSIITAIAGSGSYISDLYEKLDVELAANNILKIYSGVLIHHGCVGEVKRGTYDEVVYAPGTSGMLRKDLVVARYRKDAVTDLEYMDWHVLIGIPDAVNPQVPEYTEGDLQNGDLIDDCPFAVISLDGVNASVEVIVERYEKVKMSESFLAAHPVGNIFFSIDSTNPGTIYGGTWEAWGAGRVPTGVEQESEWFGTVEKKGGVVESYISGKESAIHSHNINLKYAMVASGNDIDVVRDITGQVKGEQVRITESAGGGETFNKLQPYITCYMWKRTA